MTHPRPETGPTPETAPETTPDTTDTTDTTTERAGGAVGWPSSPPPVPPAAAPAVPPASPEPAPHGDPVLPAGSEPEPSEAPVADAGTHTPADTPADTAAASLPEAPVEEPYATDVAEDLEGDLGGDADGWTEPEGTAEALDGDVPDQPAIAPAAQPAETDEQADEQAADEHADETWSDADGDLDEQPLDERPLAEPLAEPALAAEPALVVAPEPAGRGGLLASRALLPALVGLVVVLALLTGLLWYQAVDSRGPGPVDAARREAVDAARSSARLVFSYDYRHLQKDFAAGQAVTTGEFRKEYDKTTSRLVDDVAKRYKAVVVADVSEASVVSSSRDRVVALVFLNQQSSSTLATAPKITQSRLEMTLVRSGDRWLVSRIKAL